MRICLIGSNGSIGSYLNQNLTKHQLFYIDQYDETLIKSFEVILYFGEEDPEKIIRLAKIMSNDQLLIIGAQNLDEHLVKSLPVRSIGLRLGSDDLHLKMLKSALFTGRIHVSDPFEEKAILSTRDLSRALEQILEKSNTFIQNEIFDFIAFTTTIHAIASDISLKTGAKVIHHQSEKQIPKERISFNSKSFQERMNFIFLDDNLSMVDHLLASKDDLLRFWMNPIKKATPCFVCGDQNFIELVNLGGQPLADRFVNEKITCQEYPLSLLQCDSCHHNQLGDLEEFSSNVTRETDDQYESFARKVTLNRHSGTVLEISSVETGLLENFSKRGWKVTSMKNLEEHFDLIVSWNLFAQTSDPKGLLMSCKEMMTDTTSLYIRTPQLGEFSSIIHRNLSYFTIESMKTLVENCGLHLDSVESLGDSSYLFLVNKNGTKSVEEEQETDSIRYQAQALEKKSIIVDLLNSVKKNGFVPIGFGASIEGNTLLNSIRKEAVLPEYIIDEDIHKQHLYTPGTQIQILPYPKLIEEKRAVAVLVLTQNSLEETKTKVSLARAEKPTLLIVPFPEPELLVLKDRQWKPVTTYDLEPVKSTVKTVLVSHFYNEELLLPYWIMHHAPYFDHAVLIDYDSTDRSREIIERLAPKTWKVVTSRNRFFDALQVDLEVRDVEKTFPDDYWKVTLNTTEYMMWPRFKEDLEKTPSSVSAYRMHELGIVGDNSVPLNPELPLVQQRNQPYLYAESRYIHRNTNNCGNLYTIGRHTITIPHVSAVNAILFKYVFAPWPEILPRKLQMGARQPKHDIVRGFGYQHQWNKDQIENERLKALSTVETSLISPKFEITDLQLYRRQILYEHLGTYL